MTGQRNLFRPDRNVMLPTFRSVLMDPPWLERGGGKSKRGADRHYPLMDVAEIYSTVTKAVPWQSVGTNAHLWMWATDNFLPDAMDLMRWLGFRYLRMFVWVKVKKQPAADALLRGTPLQLSESVLQIGLGQYLRGSHEVCLLGTRGAACVPPTDQRPPSVIFAPRTKHSRKPDEAYAVVERVSPGPYLEIFARPPTRPGWHAWGNEVAA